MTTKIVLLICALLFTACSHRKGGVQVAASSSVRVTASNSYSATPSQASHPTMRPYVVHGKKYYPTVVSVGSKLHGIASWYGPNFHGKLTSNGETDNMWASTAAHKTLPMNTIVKVTNKNHNRSTIVRINDRGPYVDTRIIDLSKKAASDLDMIKTGTAPVVLEILGFQSDGVKKILTQREWSRGPKRKSINSYAVQVASFSRLEGAIITQEKYDGLDGYKAIIKDMSLEGKRLYRVWLTGFHSEQEARDFIASGRVSYAFIVAE